MRRDGGTTYSRGPLRAACPTAVPQSWKAILGGIMRMIRYGEISMLLAWAQLSRCQNIGPYLAHVSIFGAERDLGKTLDLLGYLWPQRIMLTTQLDSVSSLIMPYRRRFGMNLLLRSRYLQMAHTGPTQARIYCPWPTGVSDGKGHNFVRKQRSCHAAVISWTSGDRIAARRDPQKNMHRSYRLRMVFCLAGSVHR